MEKPLLSWDKDPGNKVFTLATPLPPNYTEEIQHLLPKLQHLDYFTIPGLQQLAVHECLQPGFCSKVPDFVVGCKSYGSISFLGDTDVRGLDLDNIVFFRHGEVIVYKDEDTKPCVGSGLNKPAEVTLCKIQCRSKVTKEAICEGPELESFEGKLKRKAEEQGAKFVSYDAHKQEWKFQVEHFSRFGLDESDEDEPVHVSKSIVSMNADVLPEVDLEKSTDKVAVWQPERSDMESEETEVEGSPMQDIRYCAPQSALAHSLPQQLRLDPSKMQKMKMLFFSSGEEADNIAFPKVNDRGPFRSSGKAKSPGVEEHVVARSSPGWKKHGEESPKSVIFSKHIMKVSPQTSWKHPSNQTPSPLSRHLNWDLEQDGSPIKHSKMLLLLKGKNEQSALKRSKVGFENKLNAASCMYGRSNNIVDAALFLGCSFRVGWGPHGLLVHSGNPVGVDGVTITSMVRVEKVALDGCVRDEEGKVRDDLIELQFLSPLNLHMSLSRAVDGMDEDLSKIRLRFVQCNRGKLPSVCTKYEDLLVKQHAIEGLSPSQRLVLRHQVMVWHLLSVLFSENLRTQENEEQNDEDCEIDEAKVSNPVLEPEVRALVRRAEFSSWLQDSVRHVIQEELMDFDAKDQLKELFSLLTGRQLDDGVQLAVSRGDVRLACLVSQAGGSMVIRRDIASQLEIWEKEGLDFSLIEKDMVLVYKLLSGDIEGALDDRVIDWKRFLGLLMWYYLAPDTQLPEIIKAYSSFVEQHAAPPPIPMHVEEGSSHGLSTIKREGLYDTAYYLMLLHANQGQNVVDASRMFASSSSTFDPLDHRMAWLQHGLLESIEVLAPTQLHVLDMNFVAQLLSVGECHWAIYVALHMPPNLDYPSLHEKVIKEILNQYCEVWSTNELQQTFIERELGVPAEWLHEALGTYWQYKGDTHKAIKHFLGSMQWHRAHSLLMISVGAALFLSGEYEELLDIVTPLERNKMELDDWAVSGGIFADFFVLKNSFRSDDFTKELGSFDSKTAACKTFFHRLKESQTVWESRAAAKNRVVYSRMAYELAALLLAESKAKRLHDETAEVKLHNIVMDAPVPEDVQFCRLQGAASAFTSWLLQTVPK